MAKKKATVIGVPLDWGASKRGAAGGPEAIRRAGLLRRIKDIGVSVEDFGDVLVPADSPAGAKNFRNGAAILKVCRALEKAAGDAVSAERVPISLGGDHSLAMGSITGVSGALRKEGESIGLIWVDAHADSNTPDTSPSGNVHGMPLAHVLGLGNKTFAHLGGFCPKIAPRNACLVGVRDVDQAEAENLRRSGIRVFSMQEIDRFGMGMVIEQAIDVASDGTAGFHMSFDIDVVDPSGAPGTGVPKRGGLTYRESHLLMEMAADSERLLGLDLVEVNPLEDIQSATSELAAELIASAMGKSIY